MKELEELKKKVLPIVESAKEVLNELGSGFNESVYQSALAIELRKRKIEYMREVNIEIFYKNEAVGMDRPDFIISLNKQWILCELKVVTSLSSEHKSQVKCYLKSLPLNKDERLKSIKEAILIKFPKVEEEKEEKKQKGLEYSLFLKKNSEIITQHYEDP